MPRTFSVPPYGLHKPGGQAVVTVRHAGGVRRDVYLGPHDSPTSRQEYARLIAELAVNPTPQPPADGLADRYGPTVNEVLLAYLGQPPTPGDDPWRAIRPRLRCVRHVP